MQGEFSGGHHVALLDNNDSLTHLVLLVFCAILLLLDLLVAAGLVLRYLDLYLIGLGNCLEEAFLLDECIVSGFGMRTSDNGLSFFLDVAGFTAAHFSRADGLVRGLLDLDHVGHKCLLFAAYGLNQGLLFLVFSRALLLFLDFHSIQ